MQKTFALNTEPHVATIGDTDLKFQAEVMSDDFMDAYTQLRETQKAAGGVDLDNLKSGDTDQLGKISRGMRSFLAQLMLPESAALFTRRDVTQDGTVLASYACDEEAQTRAAKEGGRARVVDHLRLPDRVLVELLEWAVELYSGGSRPPTSSGGSATASPQAGRSGTVSSPSRASTRARGR